MFLVWPVSKLFFRHSFAISVYTMRLNNLNIWDFFRDTKQSQVVYLEIKIYSTRCVHFSTFGVRDQQINLFKLTITGRIISGEKPPIQAVIVVKTKKRKTRKVFFLSRRNGCTSLSPLSHSRLGNWAVKRDSRFLVTSNQSGALPRTILAFLCRRILHVHLCRKFKKPLLSIGMRKQPIFLLEILSCLGFQVDGFKWYAVFHLHFSTSLTSNNWLCFMKTVSYLETNWNFLLILCFWFLILWVRILDCLKYY